MQKNLKFILVLSLLLAFSLSNAQVKRKGFFQKNRYAVQKQRFGKTSKKYGKACEIFEKKRTRGEKKPLLSLGFKRKSKNKKVAEQN